MLLVLDNYLNKKVGTLSFGETKKLEFLRLIIENKKVWILDEPLSNLDEDSIELMKQTFEDHSSKEGSIIALFLLSHKYLDFDVS